MLDFREIIAKDNKFLKLVTALQKSAKLRKEQGLFVLEGLRICRDAEENNIGFYALIVSKTFMVKFRKDIEVLAKTAENRIVISDELFKRISDTATPQGVIALAKIPVLSRELKKTGRYVALEHIADPSNIGAVARTAEALGIDGIIISGDSCDVFSSKSLRASMGTLLRIPLYFCDDIIEFLNSNSLRAFACVPSISADLKIGEFKFSDGDTVIIGNEANGLTSKTIENSYKTITIAMSGKAESLNAASAAAIAIWELTK